MTKRLPLLVIAAIFVINPAAAERRGKTYPDPVKGRIETQAQCEARQQKIRDPVSGVRIQAGDARGFCSRQQGRR